MKVYAKSPHILFYTLAISSLFGACFIFIDELSPLGILSLVCSAVLFAIGIIVHIFTNHDKNVECEEKRTTKSTKTSHELTQDSFVPKYKQKPSFDFFTDSATIDTEYIQRLIDANRNLPTPTTKAYEGLEEEQIINVEFNEITRMAKVTYQCTKYYKTIERYVQENYQRYPVYSELKSKSRKYTKSYKLTNSNLENLHDEFDINNEHLYMDLITRLNNPQLVPYTYFLKALGEQLKLAVEYDNTQIENATNKNKHFEKVTSLQIEQIKTKLEKEKNNLTPCLKKQEAIQQKLEKKQKNGKNTSKLELKLQLVTSSVDKYAKSIADYKNLIENLLRNIEDSRLEKEVETNKHKGHIDLIQRRHHSLLKKFKPLQADLKATDIFNPLSSLVGIEYKKITGCYIIRNKEKNKYYVGQSKDVLRRLKQHFKNTVPNNPIFAEDYYTSKWENKEDLFEFRVIELETKDELDKTEASLIEKYDAFNNGYNGTHGNK